MTAPLLARALPLLAGPRAAALASVLALAALAILACASSPPARLTGTTWAAVAIDGAAIATARPSDPPSLAFDEEEHRVTGSTGCNQLTGTYTLDGERLSFSPLATTKRACPGEAMTIEGAFLRALQATAAHRLGEGTLELLDAAGSARVRLEPATAAAATPAPGR